jgi:hypothetical protein
MAVHVVAERQGLTRGVIFVHASPRALCPHLEWIVSDVLGTRVGFDWLPQPVIPGQVRAEYSWQASTGTAARLTSALRSLRSIRFEVAEEPGRGVEGERFAVTPELGIFRAAIGPHGDVMIHEDRLRAALAASSEGAEDLRVSLDRILGTAWDAELEPFRRAGDGVPVRWLHQVV